MNEDIAKKICIGKSIPETKRIYKAMGLEYNTPSIEFQINGRGSVEKKHRGRAKDDMEYITTPSVFLATGRELPGLTIDPRIARACALEVLRICNERGW